MCGVGGDRRESQWPWTRYRYRACSSPGHACLPDAYAHQRHAFWWRHPGLLSLLVQVSSRILEAPGAGLERCRQGALTLWGDTGMDEGIRIGCASRLGPDHRAGLDYSCTRSICQTYSLPVRGYGLPD